MKILGISTHHDASVCILDNGNLTYFSKQERLTKIKKDDLNIRHNEKAFDLLKNICDIHKDISLVVICSPTPYSGIVEEVIYYLANILKIKCRIKRFCENHHLAHASLSFYNSGFDKALNFVIDRNGAKLKNLEGVEFRESESVFISEYPCNFKPIYKSFWLKNVGQDHDIKNLMFEKELKENFKDCEIVANSTMNITKVYETATTLIQQNILENGKTMGLSAYGNDKDFDKFFIDHQPNNNLFYHYTEKEAGYKKYIGLEKKDIKENDNLYFDYAFQVQKQTQEEVLYLVKKYVEKTNIKNVCLSGGYALNVVTNSYLINNLPDVNFYFEPLSDDSGNSIGAALYEHYFLSKENIKRPLYNTFFSGNTKQISSDGIKTYPRDIANFLNEQKVVAVFNGKAEAGPRALGNRSILFDPRNKNAKKIINKIKKREWYRPFAGSILTELSSFYFDMKGLKNSPFMTINFKVLEDKKNIIPGVLHIDNTCRIQTVDEKIPHFYELLLHFYDITNVPMLLNTSFNLSGEPLVEYEEDALKTFYNSDIDILWFPEKQIYLKK